MCEIHTLMRRMCISIRNQSAFFNKHLDGSKIERIIFYNIGSHEKSYETLFVSLHTFIIFEEEKEKEYINAMIADS